VHLPPTTRLLTCVLSLQRAVQQCGKCDVALLSHHFTAPGKEEFSDALRKVS
jgi:hypothetical protein